MKSFWICWLVAVSLLAGLSSAAAERDKRRSPGELVNVFLAPGNAQWLVGPIAWMASEEEIGTYLAITDEETAERFIEEFWARREPVAGTAGLTARRQFESRAEEADRLYGEETVPGRRTDRGTVFILYGPPDKVEHKPAQPARSSRFRARPMNSGYGQEELWRYESDTVGLDGRSPKRTYQFIRHNDGTRFAPGSEP